MLECWLPCYNIIHVTSLVVQLSPVSQEQLPTELERRESGEGGREGGTNPISAGLCYEADITVVSFIDKVTSLTFVPK